MTLKYLFYAQLLINHLLKKGTSATEVYRVIGIPRDHNDPMELELTIEQIHRLTMFFKERMGIAHCGLEIIRNLTFQNTGFLGSYALSCPTLNEAFQRTFAVHQAVNKLFTYEMEPADKPYQFTYRLDRRWEARYPESAREVMDFAIANGLYFSRKLTQHHIIPRRIEFSYEEPVDLSVYEALFQCPLYFSRESNFAIYPRDTLDLPIPTYNPTLLKILEEYATKTIQEETAEKNIISTVRSLIIKSSHTIIPHINDIAFQLNISARNLQNKLKEQGTTYKQILEEVQKELTISYLQSDTTSNKEIAWLMGYNDLGNFYRAFKRWTGKTPNEFRNMV